MDLDKTGSKWLDKNNNSCPSLNHGTTFCQEYKLSKIPKYFSMFQRKKINNGWEGLMNREVTPTCGRGTNIALVGREYAVTDDFPAWLPTTPLSHLFSLASYKTLLILRPREGIGMRSFFCLQGSKKFSFSSLFLLHLLCLRHGIYLPTFVQLPPVAAFQSYI